MAESSAGSQVPRLKLHGKTKLTGRMLRPEQDDARDAAQGSETKAEAFEGEH